ILNHVPERAGFLVITASLADDELFTDRDLNVINGVAIPKPLENGVRETEHQNVLHGLFAKIMVNAEDLLFASVLEQFAIQLAGGFQIVAERFFDHDALP